MTQQNDSQAKAEHAQECHQMLGRLIAETGWPVTEHGMTGKDLLVTDPVVVAALESRRATELPKLLPVTAISKQALEQAARVFVLLSAGERRLVRQLEQNHPHGRFISVTYGEHVRLTKLQGQLDSMDLTAMVGSRFSGFPYLSTLMAANKLATVIDVFDSPMTTWVACAQDFDFARYMLSRIAQLDHSATKGRVCILLDLDLLEALADRKLLRPAKIKFFAERTNARLVYVVRRNKADQAAMRQIAAGCGARTLPQLRQFYKDNFPTHAPDPFLVRQTAFRLITMESWFERLMDTLQYTRVVTFEEATSSPVEIVKMLEAYLELGGLKRVAVTDATDYLMSEDWRHQNRQDFRDGVLDYLGIVKNRHGSFSTKTELLSESG